MFLTVSSIMLNSNVKLKEINQNLKKMEKVSVAFSGGVDSTFLVKTAYDTLGKNAIAITATSAMHPQWELKQAKKIAKEIGIKHILINSERTYIEKISENSKDRCYYCKRELFSKIKQAADKKKIKYVLDGSNADDVNDYRPGFKAIKELGIISPLKDVGLTKKEIRDLSKEIGLATWNKPSFACLASRFPYGTKITKEKLQQIEQCEEILRKLDIQQFRVRYHKDIARIEVFKNDFQTVINNSNMILKKFKELGFRYVTIDLQGYRQGSLNEVL